MAYITVQDMRDEGFRESGYSNTLIQSRINLCTSLLEKWTSQFFEPRDLVLTLDGSAWGTFSPLLQLDVPIIAIESVELMNPDGTPVVTMETTVYKIYNRHLTERLKSPDDRRNPRIEVVGSIYHPWLRLQAFPGGRRNVRITGTFGHTEWDETEPQGVTSPLVKHVMKLLVARYLPKLNDMDDREDRQRRPRLLSERTRDQAYTLQPQYGSSAIVGPFTGDREIDDIVMELMGPVLIGGA